VTLPKGVRRVVARGREYFYFQTNRGAANQGPRVTLPNDPHSPEFWIAIRKAQGIEQTAVEPSLNTVCDLYETSKHFAALAPASQDKYRRTLKQVRAAWGDLPATGLRPVHVRTLLDEFADKPGTANNILGALWALNKWGRARGHFDQSVTEGVEPYKLKGGTSPGRRRSAQRPSGISPGCCGEAISCCATPASVAPTSFGWAKASSTRADSRSSSARPA
jgi:hypothetical protein